ncbi:hypothetical protein CYY_004868 [Polysphondylium violaceum]|uniref:palmitoyl-protein hydrolase n=1 Tax=Polysphondylium violaceum TaxID=133409 RepID=A0A8J4PUH9_9MYCE|nr:hypothetical protein CYY_004868 [Polysphondylium violaceum]
MNSKITLVLVLLGLISFINAVEYRPVVVLHGITTDNTPMELLVKWIEEALPNTYVVNMEIGNGKIDSIFMHMEDQVEEYAAKVAADPKLANGFNAIGFSQGTLVTRGYIQKYNNPPVYNYISWNGPQSGQFGTPFVNIKWIDKVLGTTPYAEWAQNTFSCAQYWKDPYKLEKYLEVSQFLADLNNEREVKNPIYRERITSLNAFVMSYSTEDSTIVPKESGWFGFYANDTQSAIVPLEQQPQYTEDWIGLRTLDERGALIKFTTDCVHKDHPSADACKPYFTNFTLPWLSEPL